MTEEAACAPKPPYGTVTSLAVAKKKATQALENRKTALTVREGREITNI